MAHFLTSHRPIFLSFSNDACWLIFCSGRKNDGVWKEDDFFHFQFSQSKSSFKISLLDYLCLYSRWCSSLVFFILLSIDRLAMLFEGWREIFERRFRLSKARFMSHFFLIYSSYLCEWGYMYYPAGFAYIYAVLQLITGGMDLSQMFY